MAVKFLANENFPIFPTPMDRTRQEVEATVAAYFRMRWKKSGAG